MFNKLTVFEMIKKERDWIFQDPYTTHMFHKSYNQQSTMVFWTHEKVTKLSYCRQYLNKPSPNSFIDLRPTPFPSLYLYAGSGKPFNSSQVRVTAVTEWTRSCSLEASPLLKIKDTTSVSTPNKLFIRKWNFAISFAQARSNMALWYCNGFSQSVSRQRLGKHIPACNNARCVSVDECYCSLLGNSQRANELAG
jgi:hypothetical protein